MGHNGAPPEKGFILLSAGIIDSPIFRASPDVLRLWLVLLCSAHRSETPIRMMGGVEVRRGEMVTSLSQLADQLKRTGNRQAGEPQDVTFSKATVRRYLKQLDDEEMIEVRSTRQAGTWIRVVNFEFYQTIHTYIASRANSSRPSKPPVFAPDSRTDGKVTELERTRAAHLDEVHPVHRDHLSERESSRVESSGLVESSTSNPVNDSSTGTASIEWQVWSVFAQLYVEKNSVPPTVNRYTQSNLESIVRHVRGVMKRAGKSGDENLLRFVRAALNRYFEMDDPFVSQKAEYNLGAFTTELPKISKRIIAGSQ